MKNFQLLLTMTLAIVVNLYGQSKNKSNPIDKTEASTNKLIGTWRLIEFADIDSGTTWTYPFGKNPKGYFTYTKNNVFNLNISSEVPLNISKDSAKKYSINLYDFLWHYSLGYFGVYSIDAKNSTVTHHVKGGTIPFYIDTDQLRPFTLKNDTLIIGDNKTWKRVLVKAD